MKSKILAVSLLFTLGCAGGYKASYVTGAVTKQFATESYDVYSKEFNKKLTECDPATNESVNSKSQLDECMGPAYAKPTHEKIETSVKAYHEAAVIHTETMIAIDGTSEERKAATEKVLKSAMTLIELFPDGEKLVKKLKQLTGAK